MPVQELERKELDQAVDAASNEAKKYREYLTTELVKLDSKIDVMAANVKQASAEIQADYESRLNELKEQRQTLDHQLNEVQQASESAFETLKSGLETTWRDLTNTFHSMHDDFNCDTH